MRRPTTVHVASRWALVPAAAALLAAVALPAAATAAATPPVPGSVEPILSGDLEPYQWMLDAVNAPQAWHRSTGSGVTVAVLDTGVDSSQPDLDGQVVPGGVVTKVGKTWSVADAPLSTTNRDTIGHGTHVAGIIAANDDGQGITGIAPDARIMPVAWPTSLLAQMSIIDFYNSLGPALEYATDQGAQVVNISLGGSLDGIADTASTHFAFKAQARACQAVKAAEQAGVFVSVAAGNDGMYLNEQSMPAACDGAFSVAATGPDLDRAFFSSYDPTVQLAAPGLNVLSVASGKSSFRGGHMEESGTSMASPVVAGTAALVRALHPAWTPSEVADDLTSAAEDLGPAGRDPETGFGAVDAAAAVGAAAPAPQPSDYVSALAVQDLVLDEQDGPQPSIVSWTMPAVHAVTGYTVTVFDSSGTTTHDVDGLQVRLHVDLAADAWAQVTAHKAGGGDVTSFPTPLVNPWDFGGGEGPPGARHITVDRHGRAVDVSWQLPKHSASRINTVRVYVYFPSAGRRLSTTLKVPHGQPVPRHVRFVTPRSLTGHDCEGVGILTIKHEAGGWSAHGVFKHQVFPAVHGLAVDAVVPAGPHGVEVAGSMARSAARDACGSSSCAGRQVQLVVRYGSARSTVTARLTRDGQFHADVWRPQGAARLQIQVRGPGGTTSGAFWPYQVH